MKIKTILLTLLGATALNLPAHAQEYTYLIVDGTAHPAESGTTYTATPDNPALMVIGNGGEGIYTGTNITLINNNPFNPFSEEPNFGAYANNQGKLSLTDSNITAPIGIGLVTNSSNTLNNVTINAALLGVMAQQQSTLNLTGGNITLSGYGSMGIALMGSSTTTVSGVGIDSEAYSMGVNVLQSSTLTLSDSTLTTAYAGVAIQDNSIGTLNNVNITTTMDNDEEGYGNGVYILDSSTLTLTGGNIETSGTGAHGIKFDTAATGTITNVNITATGEDAHALHLNDNSTATAKLNNKTLTGGITAEVSSTLTLTGSNATHLNGDITTTDHSTVNLTLTGENTQLNGNLTQDETSAINLTLDTGAMLTGGGELNSLTLTNGVTITHTATLITVTDSITINGTVTFDLSDLTTTGDYDLIDWTGAGGNIDIENATYTYIGPGIQGTFNTDGTKLTFTATAIPEPTTYLLLGIGLGILLLTVRRRNTQS